MTSDPTPAPLLALKPFKPVKLWHLSVAPSPQLCRGYPQPTGRTSGDPRTASPIKLLGGAEPNRPPSLPQPRPRQTLPASQTPQPVQGTERGWSIYWSTARGRGGDDEGEPGWSGFWAQFRAPGSHSGPGHAVTGTLQLCTGRWCCPAAASSSFVGLAPRPGHTQSAGEMGEAVRRVRASLHGPQPTRTLIGPSSHAPPPMLPHSRGFSGLGSPGGSQSAGPKEPSAGQTAAPQHGPPNSGHGPLPVCTRQGWAQPAAGIVPGQWLPASQTWPWWRQREEQMRGAGAPCFYLEPNGWGPPPPSCNP